MESAAKSCCFVVLRYDVPNANVSWIEAIVGAMVCADCSGLNNETCIQPRRRGCCSFKASEGLQPFSINCSQNPCHNSLYGAAFFPLSCHDNSSTAPFISSGPGLHRQPFALLRNVQESIRESFTPVHCAIIHLFFRQLALTKEQIKLRHRKKL